MRIVLDEDPEDELPQAATSAVAKTAVAPIARNRLRCVKDLIPGAPSSRERPERCG
jgi:hypothetical protein